MNFPDDFSELTQCLNRQQRAGEFLLLFVDSFLQENEFSHLGWNREPASAGITEQMPLPYFLAVTRLP